MSKKETRTIPRGGTIDTDNLTRNLLPAQAGMNSGAARGEPENPEQDPAPRGVERSTALRGQAIAPGRVPARVVRKNTEDELKEKNPEVPCIKMEQAIRDLVCSLMERQDRMNEEILLRVVDLQYRMDDLEDDRRGPGRSDRKVSR